VVIGQFESSVHSSRSSAPLRKGHEKLIFLERTSSLGQCLAKTNDFLERCLFLEQWRSKSRSDLRERGPRNRLVEKP
jgi:hypothetical protein